MNLTWDTDDDPLHQNMFVSISEAHNIFITVGHSGYTYLC
jgi:hypothetical protein